MGSNLCNECSQYTVLLRILSTDNRLDKIYKYSKCYIRLSTDHRSHGTHIPSYIEHGILHYGMFRAGACVRTKTRNEISQYLQYEQRLEIGSGQRAALVFYRAQLGSRPSPRHVRIYVRVLSLFSCLQLEIKETIRRRCSHFSFTTTLLHASRNNIFIERREVSVARPNRRPRGRQQRQWRFSRATDG